MKTAKEFLALHAAYLAAPTANPRPIGAEFNLSSADLRSANLSSADLRFANLRSADLRFANLSSANLHSANLRSADLHSADLSSADLRSANLHSADLHFANLSSADLRSADLRSADLSSANLFESQGQRYAQISFSGHGECGRQLLAVTLPDGPRLFCGCFTGTEADLRAYIADGAESYRASRTLALDTVLQLLRV